VRVDNLDAATGRTTSAAGANAPPANGTAGVVNEGNLSADDVVISSGDIYSLALINKGQIHGAGGQATLSGNGLVSNEGVIDVSDRGAGGRGGDVRLLGRDVAVTGRLTPPATPAAARW
jgi:hypothetical protein